MTNKRLQEIKDSIEFQLQFTNIKEYDDTLIKEEKELYDYAINLQSKIDKAIEYVNTWLVDEYSICVPDKKEPDVFCHCEPDAKDKLLDILKEDK